MTYIIYSISIALIILTWLKPKWAMFLMIALIPFHAFIVTYLNFHFQLTTSQQQILASWKEIILAVLAIKIIWQSIKLKQFPFKILFVDKLIFVLFILALITIPFLTKNLTISILGLRYDFEMFFIFYIIRSFDWTTQEIKNVLWIIFGAGIIISIFALIQTHLLPKDFLVQFGYLPSTNYIGFGPVPAFQVIGNSGVLRAQSFLSGPNQLGSYALILLSLSLSGLVFYKNLKLKIFFTFCFLLFALTLFYTYSRSAWAGFAIMLVVFSFTWLYMKSGIKNLWKLGLIYLVIFGGILFFANMQKLNINPSNPYSKNIQDIYLHHQGSDLIRFSRVQDSLKILQENPFGLGIGKAGMVANLYNIKYKGNLIIPENWYLQIAIEMGILGIGIYLIIIYEFFKNFWRAIKKSDSILNKQISLAIFLAFSGISICSLFLHAWSDITTTLIFWFIAGLVFENIYKKEISK
jgi:O-antigen ligase